VPDRIVKRGKWTGANTVQARKDGAEAVAGDLNKLLADHPQAKAVLVAHSHGGAVAIKAARQCEHVDRVAGIACLATPFLHATPRDISRVMGYADTVVWTLAVISLPLTLLVARQIVIWTEPVIRPLAEGWTTPLAVILLLTTFAFGLIGPAALFVLGSDIVQSNRTALRRWLTKGLSHIGSTLSIPAAIALVVALLSVATFAGWWLASLSIFEPSSTLRFDRGGVSVDTPGRSPIASLLPLLTAPFLVMVTMSVLCLIGSDQEPQELAASLSVEPPANVPMLIIRRPADEASSVLAVAHFVGWITGFLWRAISVAFRPGLDLRPVRPLFLLLGTAVAMLAVSPHRPVVLGIVLLFAALWTIFGILSVIPFTAAWITWVLFFPIAAGFSVFLAPFGFDLMFAGPLIEVAAESCPRGTSTVIQLDFGEPGDERMRHSVYHDPRCVEELNKWLATIRW
jgi:pimeloyl-ACP methyl ester carboxylesterase